MSWFVPSLTDEPIGPGTANTSRPRFRAKLTVCCAPLFSDISTTNTPAPRAAMSRFRRGKWPAMGGSPGANSEIRSPSRRIREKSARFSAG
jgi:hypothetical protein